jgi:hypothetical protein
MTMRNRHVDSGKFMAGQDTGQYQGRMKHGEPVSSFKDALHTVPSRNPVRAHAGCPSVGTGTLADISARGATTAGLNKNGA